MNIETVKELELVYLINNSISIPKNPENRDYRKVQQWIADGGIVEPEFTTAEKIQNKIDELTSSRRSYLNSTDWRCLRFVDVGDTYPQSVKDKRALARQEINTIEVCATLEQLNAFNIEF